MTKQFKVINNDHCVFNVGDVVTLDAFKVIGGCELYVCKGKSRHAGNECLQMMRIEQLAEVKNNVHSA